MSTTSSSALFYVVLAEFHLNDGSTLRAQYPSPVPYTNSEELANFMLPDGAHTRTEDWTVFFLADRTSDSVKDARYDPKRNEQTSLSSEIGSFLVDAKFYFHNPSENSWSPFSDDEIDTVVIPNPDIYDDIRSRSPEASDVICITDKAMKNVIASIPLSPSTVVDELSYDSESSIFLSFTSPNSMTYGLSFSSSRDRKLFQTHVIDAVQSKKRIEPPSIPCVQKEAYAKDFLYGCSIVINRRDDSLKRGASFKALGICTPYPHYYVYRRLLRHFLQENMDCDAIDLCQTVYDVVSSFDYSFLDEHSILEKRVIKHTIADPVLQYSEAEVELTSDTTMSLYFPTTLSPFEVGDDRASIVKLMQKFGPSTMTIYNAILSEKRVLFLGQKTSVNDICSMVLAAAAMVSDPLSSVISRRVFPYVCLHHVEVLQRPGCIAGIANPMAEQRDSWWDLLCKVDTGEVIRSPVVLWDDEFDSRDYDEEFFTQAQAGVQSHIVRAAGNQTCEEWIRLQFHDLTRELINMVTGDADFVTSAVKKRTYDVNRTRLDLLRQTKTFDFFLKERESQLLLSSIDDVSVFRHLEKLRVRSSIEEEELLTALQDLNRAITSPDQVLELLSRLPDAQGGLYRIAVCLFHPAQVVRLKALALLRRISNHPLGSRCLLRMNAFLRIAFERSSEQLPSTD